MPRGVKLPQKFSKRFEDAAEAIQRHRFVRVVSHYDADGITAASVMLHALRREGKTVQVSIVKSLDAAGVERFSKEDNECVVFLDMGSGQIDGIEKIKAEVVVLDHHQPIRDSGSVVQVNPHFFGLDGMKDICASGMAFVTSLKMDDSDWSMAPAAITGIIGDMQNLGGCTEINASIIKTSADKGLISKKTDLRMSGNTLLTMFSGSSQPFIKGVSGRESETGKLLESSGFDPQSSYDSLDDAAKKRLRSLLTLRLLSQGCESDVIEEMLGEIIRFEAGPLKGMTADFVTDLVNACGRMDKPGMGIALCLGDSEAAEGGAGYRTEYIASLIKELRMIEDGAVETRGSIHIIRPVRASLAGAICGISMQYILDKSKPTIALTKVEGSVKASTRGTSSLVRKGLDLSEAMKVAAKKLDGVGGGHKVAAGATVPLAREDDFLKDVDEIVGKQFSKK